MRCGQSRKRDGNERDIVKALRKLGCLVIPISGKDAPDLLVKFRGFWWPLEVKSKGGKVTDGQLRYGYSIVRTPEEAVTLLKFSL